MRTLPLFVPVLIICLFAVAAMKLSRVGFGFSSASGAPAFLEADESAEQNRLPAAQKHPGSSSGGERLAALLAERSAALDRREAEIDTREKLLQGTERRLEALEIAIRADKIALAAAERQVEQAEVERFRALSTAYERMKPRDAAPIFETLGDDILEPIAAGMRTQALAGVLAEMKPEKARALTEKLAARARREASRAQADEIGSGAPAPSP